MLFNKLSYIYYSTVIKSAFVFCICNCYSTNTNLPVVNSKQVCVSSKCIWTHVFVLIMKCWFHNFIIFYYIPIHVYCISCVTLLKSYPIMCLSLEFYILMYIWLRCKLIYWSVYEIPCHSCFLLNYIHVYILKIHISIFSISPLI